MIGLALLLGTTQVHSQSRANKFFERFDYAKAIPLYQKHIRKNPSDIDARARLADCYRLTKQYEKAEQWYAQTLKTSKPDPDNYFYYAQALMNNGKYEEAVPQLERYLEVRGWNEIANNMLEASKDPRQFFLDSAMYIVRPVNINTPGPEFGPVIYNNSVVFAAAQNRDKVIHNWTGQAFLDLYAASYSGSYRLGEPQPMAGTVNSRYHEGGATFSPDGLTMYFTRNNFNNGKLQRDEESIVRLKAYKAQLVNGKWSNVSEFPFNSDDYSVGHPCMDPDGQVIYFISDMPGGAGGTDIYMTRKQGPDKWSKPINLGDKVNSPGNEMFPWVSSSGVLYFASNGRKGLGGLDIYRLTSVGTPQEKVSNMGFPVNSPQDDFALVIDEASGQGFFTSNRKGGKGDDDLYSLRQKQVVEGIVLDERTGEPVPEATIQAFDGNGPSQVAFSDAEGRFRMPLDRNKEFMLVADQEFYLEKKQRLSTVSFDPRVPIEALIKLEQDLSCEPPYVLDGNVKNDSNEIISNATVRVMPKPFTVDADSSGQFMVNLQADMEYDIRVEKEGYMDRVYEVNTTGMDPGEIPLDAVLAGLDATKDTSMYSIYYDYNKADLRSKGYKELDNAIEFLNRNPTVKIRLISHADARGNVYYNDRLSRKRSLAAYEYLVREGIPEDRVEVVWVGESRPQNDCIDGVDCPEEEHQKNRRTEVQYSGQLEVEDLNPDETAPELEIAPKENNPMNPVGEEVIKDEEEGAEGEEEEGEEIEDGSKTLGEAIDEVMDNEEAAEEAVDETVEEAAEEVEEAVEEGEEAVEEAAEEVEEAVEEVVEETEAAVEAERKAAEETVEEVKEEATEAVEEAVEEVAPEEPSSEEAEKVNEMQNAVEGAIEKIEADSISNDEAPK